MTHDALFEAKLKRTERGCLEYDGSRINTGYGKITRRKLKNGTILAHHYAWFLETGKWPEDQLLHSCDNPPCCEVGHLTEGDQLANMADAKAKGRIKHGEAHHAAKLSEADIIAIRAAPGRQVDIAQSFCIDQSNVSYIKRGKTWASA